MSEPAAAAVAEPVAATQAAQSSAAPSGGFLASSPEPSASPQTDAPKFLFAGDFHEEGRFKEGWTSAFQEKFPSLAGKLSTAKDHDGALSILNNAVQVAGRRELKGPPDETWQPHELAEHRRAFGVPEDPSGYKFAPEDPQHGQHWDQEAVKNVEALMHKHNIPAPFAKELQEVYSGILQGQTERAMGEFQTQIEGLSKESAEWAEKTFGQDAPNRVQALKDYALTLFTPEEQKTPIVKMILSHPKVIQEFNKNYESLREGTHPGSNNNAGSGSKSPQQQMESLMAEHPDWQSNPMKTGIAQRMTELASLQAAQDRRKR